MESIAVNPLLEYHPNTLQVVRKMYGLETPEMVNESIDRLQEWIQKQNYFRKKDFSRDYLEKLIISSKGSVERAKERFEKICMLRTVAPSFFVPIRANELTGLDTCKDVVLPKLTKNYYRVYVLKAGKMKFDDFFFQNYIKHLVLCFEYWMKYDYVKGAVGMLDTREANSLEFLQAIVVPKTRSSLHMFFECYVARLQAIHVLTNSKLLNVIATTLKSIFTPKIAQRFQYHNTLESLHQVLEKDILPIEYGGKEKSILELQKKALETLSTNEFMETLKEMQHATVDSALKSIEDFGDRYNSGQAGTFRKLNVD